MAAAFDIDFDPVRGQMRITLGGFFMADEIAAFVTALTAAYAGMTTARGQHLTLVDVRACKIQAQETVEAFRAILRDPARQARRLAFVTGNSAAKMQIRRLIERDTARAFDDIGSAEAWLRAGGEVVGQAAPRVSPAPGAGCR